MGLHRKGLSYGFIYFLVSCFANDKGHVETHTNDCGVHLACFPIPYTKLASVSFKERLRTRINSVARNKK